MNSNQRIELTPEDTLCRFSNSAVVGAVHAQRWASYMKRANMKVQNLALAVLAMLGTASPAFAADWPQFPFVYVMGEASAEVAPDVAKITFDVTVFDEDSNRLMQELSTSTQSVIDTSAANSVGKGDITSEELAKRAVRAQAEGTYEPLKVLGYEASRGFTITLMEVKRYSELIDALAALPNVTNLNTTFDIKNREAVEKKVTLDAEKDAIGRAKDLALGAGAELGKIHAVSQRGFYSIPSVFGVTDRVGPDGMFEKRMAPDDTANAFVPKSIKIENAVYLIVQLRYPESTPPNNTIESTR